MKLYLRYVLIHLKSAMQHKTSFFLMAMGQFLATFTALLGLYFMMSRFYQVDGFSLDDVLISFATISLSFALAEMFARGFDSFSILISNGEFDRMLVRPKSLILQVLGSRIELSRIGRLVQAGLIFTYIIPRSHIDWTWDRMVTLIAMIIGGTMVFIALFLLYASLCFFTIEGLEFINIFTDGGREFGQYPFSIYGEKVLKFLTYIVPLALVQYYPLLYLLGRSNNRLYMVLPLLASLFLFPAYLMWQIGLRHYKSTGS